MILILVLITALISISTEYFQHLKNEREQRERVLREALGTHKRSLNEVMNY